MILAHLSLQLYSLLILYILLIRFVVHCAPDSVIISPLTLHFSLSKVTVLSAPNY